MDLMEDPVFAEDNFESDCGSIVSRRTYAFACALLAQFSTLIGSEGLGSNPSEAELANKERNMPLLSYLQGQKGETAPSGLAW